MLLGALFIYMLSLNVPAKDAKAFAAENITWHGQSCFEVRDAVTVLTDPFKLTRDIPADIILITHPHFDHFSPDDINRAMTSGTVIIAPDDPEISTKLKGGVKYVKPGDAFMEKGVRIEVVPAYNTGNKQFHPKSKNWVGYVFSVDGVRVYTAGDTDRIPEMKKIRADIALLPVGGYYTMGADEAAQCALDIMPKVAIPMHYGAAVGSPADAEKFRKDLLGKVDVIIKQKK